MKTDITYLQAAFDLNNLDFVSTYDELPLWAAPFGQKILNNFPYKKNISVLDIGCGSGFPTLEIAMRLGTTCAVYGLDPWKTGLKRAEAKCKAYGLNNVTLLDGVAENIPLPKASIDIVISNNGLNNVQNLEIAISECHRVLKAHGQIQFTFNLNTSMLEFYSIMENALLELGISDCIIKMRNHINERRRPVQEFVSILNKHGFSSIEIAEDAFQYHFSDGTAMLNHHFIKLAFLDGWKSVVPANMLNDAFSLIETGLNMKAAQDGSLTLSIPYVFIKCKKE